MRNISNGLKIAVIYASVFVGAGFVSGQELLQYFVRFGQRGMAGIMTAGALFALVGWAVLRICKRQKITNYHGLMTHLFGPKFGSVMEGIVTTFSFCLFVAVFAGAGATGREAFGLPFTISALAVGLCVFLILCFGLTGIIKMNMALAPFLLLGGIFLGLYTFFARSSPVFAHFLSSPLGVAWLLSALVYASYNLVTAVPVLSATAPMAAHKKDAAMGGLLGGGLITVLGISMALPLFLHYRQVVSLEIPFLYIATYHGHSIRLLYLAVLIAAIITTAACNAFAVMEWLKSRGFHREPSAFHTKKFTRAKIKTAAMLCAVGVAASHVGFSTLVTYVYPAFGVLGLFKILVVLWHGFWYTGYGPPD